MGNREALLQGAKQCIYERGYARTTARDVAAAAGVSLAAIGYHFGTIETLLNRAMIEAIGDWGNAMERALRVEGEDNTTPQERFATVWTRVIESFSAHRPLWAASFEVFAQIDHAPEVRAVLADAFEHGRSGLTDIFGLGSAADEQSRHAIGSLYQALMTGLLAQWLVDPTRAPSGADLATAWQAIAIAMAPSETGAGDPTSPAPAQE